MGKIVSLLIVVGKPVILNDLRDVQSNIKDSNLKLITYTYHRSIPT